MSRVPVLIVGAGPSGLMLSLELSRHGISHRIIDAATDKSPYSRALVLHSRTLELLSCYDGLVEELIPLGRFNMAVRVYVNQKFVSEMDVEEFEMTDTRYPTPLLISQAETELVLEAYVQKNGIHIERGVRAEKLEQHTNFVQVGVKSAECQEELITCQYVVGCDGAHSIVRRSTGVSFVGEAYPQDFILADLRLTWSLKNNISIFMGSHGFMALFPMKSDVWRIICSRVTEKNSQAEPTMSDFRESVEKLCPLHTKVAISEEAPFWMTRFKLHHRIVNNYRDRRCFLAGDSAHIHSPAGGQGMNTGMQDSINLAWKLAAVINGERKDGILDTYNTERHRIGEHLLERTDRGFEFMTTSSPVSLWLRNTLTPWILAIMDLSESNKRSRFRFVSELDVRYRHSSMVSQGPSRANAALKGGDRMPDGKLLAVGGEIWLQSLLKAPKHHVVLLGGVGNRAKAEDEIRNIYEEVSKDRQGLECHVILDSISASQSTHNDEVGVFHRMIGMADGGLVIIRPDGYVEWIGNFTEMNELKRWLRSCT